MNKIISKLRNDFSALFFSKTRKYRLLLFSFCSTNITKLMLSLKKVQYGGNCKFYGLPYINRAYNSKISIGQKCTFRSDRTSNLIGINRNCIISSFKENTIISIGNSCGFSGTVIGASESIVIGNDVLCGANTLITDFDWHPIDPVKRHTSEGVKSAPVIIEDNVFLGANSVVLKGVRIGKNSVIGANSVVVKDIPENVIAAGNPCKVLKQL